MDEKIKCKELAQIPYFVSLAPKFHIFFLTYWAGFEGQDSQTGKFTLEQIKAATDDFNPANKIGEGGFGPVYKVVE